MEGVGHHGMGIYIINLLWHNIRAQKSNNLGLFIWGHKGGGLDIMAHCTFPIDLKDSTQKAYISQWHMQTVSFGEEAHNLHGEGGSSELLH